MALSTPTSPHIHNGNSVTKVMLQVVAALVPGVMAYVWFFGPGVVVNMVLATVTALAVEALSLAVRGRPLPPFLSDGSAVVTGCLLALALPPLAPWWLVVLGAAFAIIIGKQLFGGLGFNPFNPAMLGYVMLLISFPVEMTHWLAPAMLAPHTPDLGETLRYVFAGQLPPALTLDSLTMATPLDAVKTQLGLDLSVGEIVRQPQFGALGGVGWQWINLAFLAGGLWLIRKKIIGWQIPVSMLGTLTLLATVFHLIDAEHYASPLFHLFSGAALLGAFFIATDPVSASTTPRGRLIFGAGIGLLTYVIRTFGGYPDGVAFAVLLMNMAAPLIDHYTRPRVYGHDRD
ncbi:MAG TPA: electron transport complex subunit RsxD [Gammaproteobacteria bacterium]|nr:electron transport complex subunit RsxD [Gammaproteobacteria bacterium]